MASVLGLQLCFFGTPERNLGFNFANQPLDVGFADVKRLADLTKRLMDVASCHAGSRPRAFLCGLWRSGQCDVRIRVA